jgi:G3E family GTPase
MTELQDIPTYLLAGPLGAGKTTVLSQLFSQRPREERWAVLINEFGAVGIDAALLGKHSGVQISEIPGGCLCCVNGLPFQVGLGRLLRKARPDRLFIEASGLGHPKALLTQLQAAPWQGVLRMEALLMVLDAKALHSGKTLPAAQADALPLADVLVLNKCDRLNANQIAAVTGQFPGRPLICCEGGAVPWPLELPPKTKAQTLAGRTLRELPTGPPAIGRLWQDSEEWECHIHGFEGWQSLGWLAHPARRFDLEQVDRWLAGIPYSRAKGVLHAHNGWYRLNRLKSAEDGWELTDAGSANRLELLMDEPFDRDLLDRGLRATSRAD